MTPDEWTRFEAWKEILYDAWQEDGNKRYAIARLMCASTEASKAVDEE